MPSCSVPCCSSNTRSSSEYVSTFIYPADAVRRSHWVRCINRKNFIPSASSVICIKHSAEQFIVRHFRATRADGSILIVPRVRPTLTSDAYPSLFANQFFYLSSLPSAKRKKTEERESEIEEREASAKKILLDKLKAHDNITSLQDMKQKFSFITDKLDEKEWLFIIKEESVLFYNVVDDGSYPKIAMSCKIFSDSSIQIYHNNILISNKNTYITSLIGLEGKISKVSSLQALLAHLNSFKCELTSAEDKLTQAIDLLGEITKAAAAGDREEQEVFLGNKHNKVKFLHEQVCLLNTKKVKYSAETLMWACKLFFSYPAAYRMIRTTESLTLPHPSYLKKLLNIGKCESGIQQSHIKYLQQKANLLPAKERIVNVLLDEIYVKSGVHYKGGTLQGLCDSTNDVATTIQTFMITSVFSKNKDVVSLFPVKSINAAQLHDLTLTVLKVLHNTGYRVLTLISDNNRVNRNMFERLCGGKLVDNIPNPNNNEDSIFLLFDTVHLFKSVRNNWLNQVATRGTFYIPSPQDLSTTVVASLLHVRKLYDLEKNHTVKLAPNLSRKVCFPTSTERQNVTYASKLFDEKTICALDETKSSLGYNEDDVLATKMFMETILGWWRIVNVKHPNKGKNLRDTMRDPIRKDTDQRMEFLSNFHARLKQWNEIEVPVHYNYNSKTKRVGKLTNETQFAVMHTTKTLISLSAYVLDVLGAHYVLLGKFQTDHLEARFGQYRQMSGGNYLVSVSQVMESEKKLKILSLLSMKSANGGDFLINTFGPNDNDFDRSTTRDVEGEDLEETVFEDVLTYSDGIEVTSMDLKAIIYIAGYVGRKVTDKMLCPTCKNLLIFDRDLEIVASDAAAMNIDETSYLKSIDRGGLKWPKDFTVSMVVLSFKIFQTLISQSFEELFVQARCHKKVLVSLFSEKIEEEISLNEQCSCGSTLTLIAKKCSQICANIFINNYTKTRNDIIELQKMDKCGEKAIKKARKLQTLQDGKK